MIKLACQQFPDMRHGRPRRQPFCKQDIEVLEMLARGKSRDEIGAHFKVTRFAVDTWVRAMKREALARTEAHLIAIAKEQGLIR
jgi:DNA-binding NarL/FixJ family response regulator